MERLNLWFLPPLPVTGPLKPGESRPLWHEGPSPILEGHKKGRYHAIERVADSPAFRDAVRAFRAVADLPKS